MLMMLMSMMLTFCDISDADETDDAAVGCVACTSIGVYRCCYFVHIAGLDNNSYNMQKQSVQCSRCNCCSLMSAALSKVGAAAVWSRNLLCAIACAVLNIHYH